MKYRYNRVLRYKITTLSSRGQTNSMVDYLPLSMVIVSNILPQLGAFAALSIHLYEAIEHRPYNAYITFGQLYMSFAEYFGVMLLRLGESLGSVSACHSFHQFATLWGC